MGRLVLILSFSTWLAMGCPRKALHEAGDPFDGFQAAVSSAAHSTDLSRSSQRKLKGLDRKTGNGTAKLDTEEFFPPDLMKAIFTEFPSPSTVIIDSRDSTFILGSVLSNDGRSNKMMSPGHLKPFQDYLHWLTDQINRSLPANEQVEVDHSDLRVSSAAYSKAGFGQWHQDGYYLAAAVSLEGQGTEYHPKSPKGSIETEDLDPMLAGRKDYEGTPRGKTLIFTAGGRMNRFPEVAATAHRSPDESGERMFLIVRYRLKKNR